MIDFYILDIAHVLLFTCTVLLFRLAPPLWAWLNIYVDQCATCFALKTIIFDHAFKSNFKITW